MTMPKVPPTQPDPDEEGDLVDEQGEESFPASDPPESGGPGI
jgi:hypothetical protein